jgi:RimJ/RimL family protein N-acetyltransferase
MMPFFTIRELTFRDPAVGQLTDMMLSPDVASRCQYPQGLNEVFMQRFIYNMQRRNFVVDQQTRRHVYAPAPSGIWGTFNGDVLASVLLFSSLPDQTSEFSYATHRDYRGQRLTQQLMEVVLPKLLERHPDFVLSSLVAPDNLASAAILRHFGFSYMGEKEASFYGQPHVFHQFDKRMQRPIECDVDMQHAAPTLRQSAMMMSG